MILFVLWGLLRSSGDLRLSLVLTLLAGVSSSRSASLAGITPWSISQVLRYLGQRGDSMFWNQSLNGLLHRLMHVGSPVTSFYGYPPFNRTIYLATIVVFRRPCCSCARCSCIPADDFCDAPSDFLIYAWPAPWPRRSCGSITTAYFFWCFCYGFRKPCILSWTVIFALFRVYLLDDGYLGAAHPADVHPLVVFPISRIILAAWHCFSVHCSENNQKSSFSAVVTMCATKLTGNMRRKPSYSIAFWSRDAWPWLSSLPVSSDPMTLRLQKASSFSLWELLPAYAARICCAVFLR